jgi:hypothetical protein
LVADIKGGMQTEVAEKRVLGTTNGPKRDYVRGNLRKLHNDELHDLNISPNIT